MVWRPFHVFFTIAQAYISYNFLYKSLYFPILSYYFLAFPNIFYNLQYRNADGVVVVAAVVAAIGVLWLLILRIRDS